MPDMLKVFNGSHLRVWVIFVCWIASFSVASGLANTAQSMDQWAMYEDKTHGFSFRYPSDLHIVTLEPDPFHIEGLVAAIELHTNSKPELDVLRIMVVDPTRFRKGMAYPMDLNKLRPICQNYKEFKIGGRTAANCVTCGRAACHWYVYVPGRMEFKIFSMEGDISEQREPKNGAYPLLSIIRSFTFGIIPDSNQSKKQ